MKTRFPPIAICRKTRISPRAFYRKLNFMPENSVFLTPSLIGKRVFRNAPSHGNLNLRMETHVSTLAFRLKMRFPPGALCF